MPSGGKRVNAGRKYKYDEPTEKVTITKIIPKSKVQEFKQSVKDIIAEYI